MRTHIYDISEFCSVQISVVLKDFIHNSNMYFVMLSLIHRYNEEPAYFFKIVDAHGYVEEYCDIQNLTVLDECAIFQENLVWDHEYDIYEICHIQKEMNIVLKTGIKKSQLQVEF